MPSPHSLANTGPDNGADGRTEAAAVAYVMAGGFSETGNRMGMDGACMVAALTAADAHDAEHGTYRVSEDLLRAYDELYEHMQWVVLPEETRILELIATVGAASRPWRA